MGGVMMIAHQLYEALKGCASLDITPLKNLSNSCRICARVLAVAIKF